MTVAFCRMRLSSFDSRISMRHWKEWTLQPSTEDAGASGDACHPRVKNARCTCIRVQKIRMQDLLAFVINQMDVINSTHRAWSSTSVYRAKARKRLTENSSVNCRPSDESDDWSGRNSGSPRTNHPGDQRWCIWGVEEHATDIPCVKAT